MRAATTSPSFQASTPEPRSRRRGPQLARASVSGGKVPKCIGSPSALQQTAGHGGFARAHGVEVADGQEGQLRMIQLLDQLHVGEDVGVAGEIDGAAVVEVQHVACGLAAVDDFAVVDGCRSYGRRGSW